MALKKLTPQELIDLRYHKEWYELVSEEVAPEQHDRNVQALLEAAQWREDPDRPIYVLALHGSGRNTLNSCAHERSNSQTILMMGLDAFRDRDDIVIDEVMLRTLGVERCNACYSSSSAWCHFPCSCFPFDDMTTLIYPKMVKADVVLMSTPVNQSMIATPLKMVIDRLISMDGGFYLGKGQYRTKDVDFKGVAVKLATNQALQGILKYDQRMFGKVGGYVISSKDQDNDLPEPLLDHPAIQEGGPLGTLDNYIEGVAKQLFHSNTDYGFLHPDVFWVGWAARPHEEMSWDKSRIWETREEIRPKVVKLVQDCIELATELREDPPKWHGGARVNRT